ADPVGAKLDDADCEREFLSVLAGAALAQSQPRVSDRAFHGALAEQRQDNVGGAFLGRGAAGAGLDRLTEVVDAEDERAGGLREFDHSGHNALAYGGIVVLAFSVIAGADDDAVDDDQRHWRGPPGLSRVCGPLL